MASYRYHGAEKFRLDKNKKSQIDAINFLEMHSRSGPRAGVR